MEAAPEDLVGTLGRVLAEELPKIPATAAKDCLSRMRGRFVEGEYRRLQQEYLATRNAELYARITALGNEMHALKKGDLG